MMSLHPPQRIFGLVLSAISAAIGLWQWTQPDAWVWPWLIATIGLFSLALLRPLLFNPAYRAWMKLGHGLGIVNTYVLLAVVFFVFITPLALFFRLIGRDALSLRFSRSSSYWIKRNKPWSAESFKNQF